MPGQEKNLKYPKVNGYELIDQIGGGGFSRVFRAVNIEESRVAACKFVANTEETNQTTKQSLKKEMHIHIAMKHPNVLEFLGAVEVKYPDRNYIPGWYMLLEYAAGGDLFDKIAPDVGIGEDIAHYYFKQLVAGMHYIHHQGVCHRDLKPENLLLDAGGTLKISDFGLSSVYMLKGTNQTRLLSERCGSLPYVAPELDSDDPYEAEPIDQWGMGVILYTMLAGNTPWDEPTHRSPEFRRYLTGEILEEEPWNRFSPDAISMVTGLLDVNWERRMKMESVLTHPWYMRPSQMVDQGPVEVAAQLAESLRMTGDMDIAAPPGSMSSGEDGMLLATPFTQKLLLFSQTQHGRRYTPSLTRFYCSLPPSQLMPLIQSTLEDLEVKCKLKPPSEGDNMLKLRVGGYDRRNVMFKGWIEVEEYEYEGREYSFCLMQRDEGNPISWRLLWKKLTRSQQIWPTVLRQR